MTCDVETVVIGAGVVGLAIARTLADQRQEVLVLERNCGIGQETSSRSSEVVHAGIYYPRGSLKARLCVEGKALLYRFADENGVASKQTGKLIVATNDAELAKLASISAAAAANGVGDMQCLAASDALALEPELTCVAALLSPSTGIVDSHGLMVALEGHLTSRGGSIVLGTTVLAIDWTPDAFTLSVISSGETARLTCRNLVVCAGHGMTQLRAGIPKKAGYAPPRSYLAKGRYFTLSTPAPFQHLIYPVPVDGGLGTHLTLDLQGRARFGPDVTWVDSLDYKFDDPDDAHKREFERSVRRFWPGLPNGALEQGYTGIRPKLSGPGEPARDFEIHGPAQHGIDRLVTLYGIESPGLTSALAIGPFVANQLTIKG
jgi:L-2-hydroxyglutarate oxidase LhgO